MKTRYYSMLDVIFQKASYDPAPKRKGGQYFIIGWWSGTPVSVLGRHSHLMRLGPLLLGGSGGRAGYSLCLCYYHQTWEEQRCFITTPYVSSTDTVDVWSHYCWELIKVLILHQVSSDTTQTRRRRGHFLLQGGSRSLGSICGPWGYHGAGCLLITWWECKSWFPTQPSLILIWQGNEARGRHN